MSEGLGYNPDCEACEGGFIIVPVVGGLADADNCLCMRDECDCDSCREKREQPPKFQKGGLVSGAGSGDRVPFRVKAGTEIVPRDSVLNSGRGK